MFRSFREEWDLPKKLVLYSLVCWAAFIVVELAVWGYAVTYTMKPELAVFWTCGVGVALFLVGGVLMICAGVSGDW